ncbi:MAG: hypothetical protein N7Q72_04825, partial [Spiroplasma sp. Tabriz.8]|nr:hypothetical protein [Spiroplasma sp. Tabriz.8]
MINTQGKPRLAKFYDTQVRLFLWFCVAVCIPFGKFFIIIIIIIIIIHWFGIEIRNFDGKPVEKQQELIRNVYGGS